MRQIYALQGAVSTVKGYGSVADQSEPTQTLSQRFRPVFDRSNLWQNLAFIFCVLFGLALIANTEPADDGVWYWYSYFLDSGKRLYADMHLALQPLYVLETSAFMAVLGKGWLVSKIPAVLHLIAYCLALLLLVRQSKMSDARKGIMLACAFFISIANEAYVFNDYHVVADSFVLYSLLILLSLRKSDSVRRTLILVGILGVLSGLTLTTRLNDGGALFAGVFVAIICLAPAKKLWSLLLFSVTTGLTLVLVVFLTGDSLYDYAMNSIFKAAGIKGSGGTLFAQPLLLPWNTIVWLTDGVPIWVAFHAAFAAVIMAFLVFPLIRKRGWWEFALAVLGLVMFVVQIHTMGLFVDNSSSKSVAGLMVLLAYAAGIWVLARFIFWLFYPERAMGWDRREILLLIPLGQMASGSLSSGGTHYSNILGAVGVLIVVMAICSPFRIKAQRPRDVMVALAILLVLCTVVNRFKEPYHWHTYRENAMFSNRVWYQHPEYGPMIIDRDLLQMIEPVCQTMRQNGTEDELLSIPFPGGNFFCSIPPWHGYVQTFFDTTSKETIQGLMNELQSSPPKWILYQRQLTTLRLHEKVYNQGNPLQQRYLDQLIQQKIDEGMWHVAYTCDFGSREQWGEMWDNKWMLIQTR